MAQNIVVGGKNFTEQQIMASMTAQLLQAKGFKPDTKAGMGSAVLRQAQESGQIDVYWEYTGTSLITYNKVNDRMSPADTYKQGQGARRGQRPRLAEPVEGQQHLLAGDESRTTRRSRASRPSAISPKKVKDGGKLTFASNAEFYARPDGLKPLEQTYGFEFARENVKRMDTGLVYQALKEKQVDVGLVFATDGRIPAFNFVVLKDDKGFFPVLRADAGGQEAGAGCQSEARRAFSTRFRPSSTTRRWRGSMPASTWTRRRSRTSPAAFSRSRG